MLPPSLNLTAVSVHVISKTQLPLILLVLPDPPDGLEDWTNPSIGFVKPMMTDKASKSRENTLNVVTVETEQVGRQRVSLDIREERYSPVDSDGLKHSHDSLSIPDSVGEIQRTRLGHPRHIGSDVETVYSLIQMEMVS